VFYDIGIEAGRGFAEGMKDSEGSMVSAASEAVSAAMEAAATAAGQPQGNLIAGIFEAYQVKTGGAASITLNQGITGLVGIGQRFADQLNQMAADIWNATASGDFGSGLIGQNWNSLDIFTKAGAANQAAFVDAGNQIRDFIVTNLQAGMDPATVFAFARQYRDELINSAVGATGDPTTINALIEALGLSEGALNAFWQQVLAATDAAAEHAKTLDEAAAAEKAKEEAEKKAGEDQEKEIERLKELIRLAGINTRPIDVHVSPPFGDPEAIGLGVANRVAYSLAG
jgi:ribosomal protein L12E/L44/L45/RPP1/RPP2